MTYRGVRAKKGKDNKGYTTVELIVVIVLIMLLAGGLIFAAVRWVENIRFQRQNEYARTIFVAAQNQLTEYSESGRLEELQKALQDSGGSYRDVVNVRNLLDSEGKPYELDKVWPESKGDSKYRDQVCTLKGTPADYQKYQEGTADSVTTALYDLVASYLYDTSILAKGVVCLELTPDDGQVFAALYSDISDDFTYEETDSRRGTVSILSRETGYRKRRMVGYYGVDTLYKATSTKLEKPTINALRLNNEDTLNLSFRIGKVPAAAGELQYEVTVYENNGKARLLFVLDGTKLKGQNAVDAVNQHRVPCKVTRFQYGDAGSITQQYLGDYQILAWTEAEGADPVVRIVLDGADQAATSLLYQQAYAALTTKDELKVESFDSSTFNWNTDVNKLKKTQSFRRFGLVGVDDIYCTVRGTGEHYKATAKKQSNTEHSVFGQAKADGANKCTYTIRNARHLYNMRYLEDYEKADVENASYPMAGSDAMRYQSYVYQLAEDVDWAAFSKGGSLFQEGVKVGEDETESQNFPSLRQLRKDSAFLGESSQKYSISGLSVSADYNEDKSLYREMKDAAGNKINQPAQRSAGLCLVNKGRMEDLVLDQIKVDGGVNVGAFCGQNAGVLKNLKVENSAYGKNGDGQESVIRGIANVGGIVGSQLVSAEGNKALEKLVNYARVTERETVLGGEDTTKARHDFGGIIGHIKTDGDIQKLQIKDSRNYGIVAAADSNVLGGSEETETENIGGIAGSAEARNQGQEALFQDCVSSPQYTEADVDKLLAVADQAKLSEKLRGKYVGGIVGYNDGGKIKDCGTEKESTAKEGYVLGGEYVGGIIGYNKDNTSEVTGTGTRGVNEAHVLGREYVGGIVGGNPQGTIKNWKNRGFVAATEFYAGGISGHNGFLPDEHKSVHEAKIDNCSSDVANTAAVKKLSRKTKLFAADYVGGITGYNNAELKASAWKPVNLVSTVTGKNFVGGVVGYNDVNAVVEHYNIVGGYVNATGTYVGGFCGLNASIRLLENEDGGAYYVRSNPNLVKGAFCVGGVIGGNIVPVKDTRKEINCGFAADNFLGELKATGAYAGGYIGSNWMVKDTETIREDIYKASKTSADRCAGTNSLREIAEVSPLLGGVGLNTAKGCTFVIDGSKHSGSSQARLGGISAKLYVGGVVGCNEKDTSLYIKNVANKTPVTAKKSVEIPYEQPRKQTWDDKAFTYSYAGGIIGKVSKKVTLENCRNRDSGTVTTKGTYTGGLCEINEGKVLKCTASSLGSSKKDYVGGIVGLNKEAGTITECKLEKGRTITGKNVVGGITAENQGTVSDVSIEGAVRAYGKEGYAGSVTARNEENGTIKLDSSKALKVQVTASGSYVGGIVGENQGKLEGGTKEKPITTKGSVSGGSTVGGAVGWNKTTAAMTGYWNEASVMADTGHAGGITGKTEGNITSCVNEGEISARQSGNAGGITAENTGVISHCQDTGLVSSPNGWCGGIAAENGTAASIESCEVSSERTLLSILLRKTLVFIGKDRAGGICAVNRGKVTDSTTEYITLNDLAGSKGNYLGGITAENGKKASVTDCNVQNVNLVSLTRGAGAGGAVGWNAGTVSDTEVQADLSFTETNMAYYGNLGGVAGKNNGALVKCVFSGTVAGTANAPELPPQYDPTQDGETSGAVIYGYGGIAGVNEVEESLGVEAAIRDCTVQDAAITGIGDATNITNIGGVAGVNGKGAEISKVTVGTGNAKYKICRTNDHRGKIVNSKTYHVYVGTKDSDKAYGHTGGVAGLNSGRIQSVNPSAAGTAAVGTDADKTSVAVENYRGHVGGIVGYNRRTGVVSKADTGENWTVYAPANAADNGCGGIIGYQAGENGLKECTNRALVVKMAAGSNGVGGLIGRMEVATARNYLIQNCKNYGDIYGNVRVGGMIGVAKYYGGTVSDCVNYGTISSNGEGTGGMIGHLYGMQSAYGAVNLTGCENHGLITGMANSHAAGMIGSATQGVPLVHLADCVNTGLIEGGTKAGITTLGTGVAGIARGSTITACRNYGYAKGSTDMGGILAANYSNSIPITVKDCFGISQLSCPIAPKNALTEASGQNFYVSAGEAQDVVTIYGGNGQPTSSANVPFYVRSVEASGISGAEYLYKIAGQATNGDLGDGSRAYYSKTVANKTYVFTFSKAINLKGLTLYWHDNGGTREQDYTIEYSSYTSGDFSFYTEVENTGSGSPGCALQQQEISINSPVQARRIRITVTRSRNPADTQDVNACLIRAHFAGTDMKGESINFEGQLKKNGSSYTAANGLTGWSGNEKVTYQGLPYETCVAGAVSGVSGAGTAVKVVPNGGSSTYKLVTIAPLEQEVGRKGFTRNPYAEFTSDADNAKNDTTDGNIRYQVFAAIDPYMIAEITGAATLAAPENVTFDDIAGGVKLSWNQVSAAQFYEYVMTSYDKNGNKLDERTERIYGTETKIPVAEINGTAVAKVKAKVKAGAYTQTGEIWSEYSSPEVEHEIANVLPTPQFHLELVQDENNTLKYKVFLDNQEEYKVFLQRQNKNVSLENIQITIKAGTASYTFTAAQAASDTYFAGDTRNVMFVASAEDKTKTFGMSAETMRESYAFNHGSYTGDTPYAYVHLSPKDKNGNYDDTEVGFYGDTAATLQYMAKLRYNLSQTYYMRTEMLAVDVGLGVPVSVSSSEVRISDTTSTYIKTMLASLPVDLMNPERYEAISLRSYPTLMSNNVVFNGHDVDLTGHTAEGKTGVTAETLKDLRVTADGYVDTNGAPLIQGGSLKGGYVIRLLPDGSYGLYYNALLAYNANVENWTPDADSYQTQMKTQVYTYNWSSHESENLQKQPEPVIRVNADPKTGKEGDPNEDTMVITWDSNEIPDNGKENYKNEAVYDYTITGVTSAGETVQILTGQYKTSDSDEAANTSGKNTLRLDTTSWKYGKVIISISRRGDTERTGKTSMLPNGAEREISLKQSLSQIESPTVELHRDQGEAQKDTLFYDVTWSNIPETERDELGSYEITAVRNPADEAAVLMFENAGELETKWNQLTAFYKEISKKDPDSNSAVDDQGNLQTGEAVWTWKAEESGMTVTKTMTLKLDNDKKTITKELKAVWILPVTDEDKNEDSLTAMIDLSDYDKGEMLQISVRALVADNAEKDRNGPAGVATELTLPSRLEVPNVTMLKAEKVYNEDLCVPVQELEENGLKLTYEDAAIDEDAKGSYQLAIAVYEEKGSESGTGAVWTEGCEAVPFGKDKPAVMDGSLREASYMLKELKRTYGGMWLKIAMRSVSDSNISSWWSDEDAVADNTTDYQWIRLPRVREETVQLREKTSDVSYNYNAEKNRYEYEETQSATSISVKQTSITWNPGELADHYKISIVRNPVLYAGKDETYEEHQQRVTDWIYLKKADSGYEVYYLTGDEELEENPSNVLDLEGDHPAYKDAKKLGMITDTQTCRLPWTGTAAFTEESVETPIQTAAWLALEKDDKGDRTITLQLPDVEQVGNDDTPVVETEQIAVQAVVDAGKKERYEDAYTSLLYRVNGEFKPAELKEPAEAPTPDITVEKKEDHLQLAFDSIQNAWLVCRIKVKDSSGKTLSTRYVSSYGSGTTDITNYVLLPLDWLQNLQGAQSLTVEAAAIDVTGKGISQWKTWENIEIGNLLSQPTALTPAGNPADMPASESQPQPEAEMPENADDTETSEADSDTADPAAESRAGGRMQVQGQPAAEEPEEESPAGGRMQMQSQPAAEEPEEESPAGGQM